MNANDALRQQRQRGVLLRERLRRLGDRTYDTDAALLTRWNPFFPRFNGHTVAQQSLEYAILLLHSDDRTYGTDDAGEANRILHRILAHQDLRPEDDPLDALLYVEVQVPGDGPKLADFADTLGRWQLSQQVDGDRVCFAAAHPDEAALAYPAVTTAEPDPLGDALHLSPGLTLRPGDLVALVNGDTPPPFAG